MFKRARSSAVVALLVFVAGLAIAACGGSSSSSSSASGANAAATGTTTTSGTSTTGGRGGFGVFASLTATQRSCLKSKGITVPTGTNFHRSGGTGTFTAPNGGTPPGGGTFTRPSGTSTTGGFGGRPGGGFFGGGRANASKYTAAFKACGVTLPTGHFGGGFAGRGGAGGGAVSTAAVKKFVACVKKNGYTITGVNTSGKGAVLPKSLQTNKKFLAAAKGCTSLLAPSGAPSGSGTTTSASST